MDEYIEREALLDRANLILAALKKIEKSRSIGKINGARIAAIASLAGIMKETPAADVAPVVHGRWEPYQVECGNPFSELEGMLIDVLRCSKCHAYFDVSEALNYCPNCGAKMDGGEEDAV